MTKVSPGSWFLSLRWKVLITVFFLMTVLTLVLGNFAYRELGRQQGFLLESQQHTLQQNLSHAVSQAVDVAVSSAHQVLLLAGPRVLSPSSATANLKRFGARCSWPGGWMPLAA